jgi:DNA-directed RNA polymerase specialized sigma24 family protein
VREGRNWEVSPEAWDSFQMLLNDDPERAGQRYEMLRAKLISAFRSRQCIPPDHWADETINRVIRKSQEEKIQNVEFYALGVAKRVAAEVHRMPAPVTISEEVPAAAANPGLLDEKERRMNCLEKCLQHLYPNERELIIEYYGHERGEKIQTRRAIAGDFGVNAVALRVRAFRIRARLAQCVRTCMSSAGE